MRINQIPLKNISLVILFIMTCSIIRSPMAATDREIAYFSAEVPVRSQSARERARAARVGLLDVLVRVSGTEDVRNNDGILASAKSAARYIDQFQYASLADLDMRDQGYKHFLKVRFSQRIIRDLLDKQGFRIWSVQRPTTLVWVVEDLPSQGKQFVTSESRSEFNEGLLAASHYYGLPLSFPLLDFEDQTTLSPNSVWDLDERAILAASERYQAEVILVGKMTYTSTGQVWSNWEVYHRGRSRVYDVRAQSLELTAAKSLAPLAEFLASQYAYVSKDSGAASIVMNVTGVSQFSDYRRILGRLSRMSSVTDVYLLNAQEDALTLKLLCDADVSKFLKLVMLSGVFSEPVEDDGLPEWRRQSRGSAQNPLRLVWNG